MHLADLVIGLRSLGIRSLSIELAEGVPQPEPMHADETSEPDPKDPKMCVVPDCGEPNGGIFGGIAVEYCERHAMARAGVRVE